MGRILLVMGVLVALVTASAAAAVPKFNTTRLYSEAEFNAAIKPYADAIAKNANDADAYRWLGVAYLHGFRLYRFGLAPYAGGFGAKAVEALERAVQLTSAPATMLALAEAYITVGSVDKYTALTDRLIGLSAPIPLK
jgi:tetratricopeptide (TPR) repeat protein